MGIVIWDNVILNGNIALFGSYMESSQSLEVVLFDLSDLVVLQVQQGGVCRDLIWNALQTCRRRGGTLE